jgi:N-acetylmuramoyl-L-alanine amidase
LEICCSLPNAEDNLRERDEDIRSRPLYANHIGADSLIHLHSNASENATSRGARVYIQADRATDYAVASSILCSMREIIQAQAAYATFPVAAAPHVENLGENRLASMPSVIVETAFHTNPTDALALQDPVFRTAAMKGVEKGYRLHREGRACETLRITSIPANSGPHNTYIPINVYFEGNPQFPVRFDTVTIACPSGGWTCRNYSTSIANPAPSPLTFSVRCVAPNTKPSATFGVRTVMVDADGVKSASFDHTYTCTRPVI